MIPTDSQIYRMILMIPRDSCDSQRFPRKPSDSFMLTRGLFEHESLLSRLLHWLDLWGGELTAWSIITLYATDCVRTCTRLIVWPGTIHRTASYWMFIWYKRSINHHSNATTTHCSYSQVTFATPGVNFAKNMYLKSSWCWTLLTLCI